MDLPYERGGLLAPYNEQQHLWVVMNDECGDGQCLLLMITTIYENRKSDTACVLNAGDHPFITHPSYVAYRLAQMPRADHVRRMLDKKYYVSKEHFEKPVFDRISAGLFQSDHCSGTVRKYASTVGLG
ncbi:hypothetical protein [Brevundimonas diminuta]|uniref:hypothetical protein n=1 Tax=Brevundimonas diminuta TaxID=293 RepID=UPI003D9A3682